MRAIAGLLLLLLPLCGCTAPEETHAKAILGAVLIDGAGGPPLGNSVVVIAGGTIRGAGQAGTVAIPGAADQIDGSGKFLVPAPVDLCDRAEPAGSLRPRSPEEAREGVARLAAAKNPVIHLWTTDAPVAAAAIDAARAAGMPVIGHVSSAAGAELMVADGASAIVGTIGEGEEIDSLLLARLRDLRVVVAPGAGMPPGQIRRLFAGGVPMGIASMGGDVFREIERLTEAGVPPLDAIVAATANGAMALHRGDIGAIQTGKRADLLLLSANPGEDIRNLRRVAARMAGGEWVK